MTQTGKQCEAWAEQTYEISLQNQDFPVDGSMHDARDYCRDPMYEYGRIWCVLPEGSNVPFEYCAEPQCLGIKPQSVLLDYSGLDDS